MTVSLLHEWEAPLPMWVSFTAPRPLRGWSKGSPKKLGSKEKKPKSSFFHSLHACNSRVCWSTGALQVSSYQACHFVSFSCNCSSVEKSINLQGPQNELLICQMGMVKGKVCVVELSKKKEEEGKEGALLDGEGNIHTCLMLVKPW